MKQSNLVANYIVLAVLLISVSSTDSRQRGMWCQPVVCCTRDCTQSQQAGWGRAWGGGMQTWDATQSSEHVQGRNLCLSPVPAERASSSHRRAFLLHRYCLQVLALSEEGCNLSARTGCSTSNESIPVCHARQSPFYQVWGMSFFFSHTIEPFIIYIYISQITLFLFNVFRLCGVGGTRRVQVQQLGRRLRWWTATSPVVPSPPSTWPSLVCSTCIQYHELLFILLLVRYQRKKTVFYSFIVRLFIIRCNWNNLLGSWGSLSHSFSVSNKQLEMTCWPFTASDGISANRMAFILRSHGDI